MSFFRYWEKVVANKYQARWWVIFIASAEKVHAR